MLWAQNGLDHTKETDMKKMGAALLLAGSVVLGAVAQAADGFNTSDEPSVADRLGTARTAIAAKDWKKALAELNVALKSEPRNADVHNLLGYSYRKQASPNLPKAFEHYQTALKLNPQHKGAHEYIGEAYLMDRKPEEAKKHLQTLERICGNKTCEEYLDLAREISRYR
jgi:Tfp pilus assembly protein PilF